MAAAAQRERVEVVPGPIMILLRGNIKVAGDPELSGEILHLIRLERNMWTQPGRRSRKRMDGKVISVSDIIYIYSRRVRG